MLSLAGATFDLSEEWKGQKEGWQAQSEHPSMQQLWCISYFPLVVFYSSCLDEGCRRMKILHFKHFLATMLNGWTFDKVKIIAYWTLFQHISLSKKNFSMSNKTTTFFHIKQCNENHQVMACVWSLYYSGSHMFDLDGCDLVDDVMGKTGKRPSIEKVKTCTFCPLMGTRFKIRFLSPSSNVATKTVFCLQSFLFLMKFR